MSDYQFEGLSISNFNAWMDGGTITFECTTKNGKDFKIEITQHVILEIPEQMEGRIELPGRIYMNNSLVPVRSELEIKLVAEFKEVINAKGRLGKMEKACLLEHLEYIESEEYVANGANHSK